MRYLPRPLFALLIVFIVCPGLAVSSASSASRDRKHAATTPIQHIVFISKENRTFDSYFGAYQCPGDATCINGATSGLIRVKNKKGKFVDKSIPLNALADSI